MTNQGSARVLKLKLTGLPANARFNVETLDKTHGHSTGAWEAMGRPDPPNREQTEALRRAAESRMKQTIRTDASGNLTLTRSLDAWSLVLIREL